MSTALGKAFGKSRQDRLNSAFRKALPPLLPSPQRKVTPAAPGFLANSPVTPFLRNKSSNNDQEEEQPAYLTFYVAQLPTTPILATDNNKALKNQCEKIKLIVTNYFKALGMNVSGKVELKQADPTQLPTGATIQVFNKMSEAELVVQQGNHYLPGTKGGSFEIAVGLLGQKWGVANPSVPGIASCTPRTWANTRPSPVAPIINKPSAVTALHTAVQIGNNQVRALRQVKQILGGGWFSGGGESSPAAPKDYVNAKDGLGWTALMKAASMGREMIVAHLIDAGADRTLVTGSARMHQKPRSAYDIAVQGFQSETCKALLQPGVKSLAQVKQFIYRDYKFDDIVDEPAAAPAEAAAPEDNKMTIDGDWELVGDTIGFGDVTTISGENGKMMALGAEIGTYTFKELDDVVKGFKGEVKCEIAETDVEGKLSEDGNELELTLTVVFASVTVKFKRKEEAPPAEEEAPPAEEEAPPAEEEAPPAEEEAPPAEEEAPPAEGEAPPAEEEAPPAEGEAPPAEEEAEES